MRNTFIALCLSLLVFPCQESKTIERVTTTPFLVLNNKDNQAKTVDVKLGNEVISLELQANSINTVTVK